MFTDTGHQPVEVYAVQAFRASQSGQVSIIPNTQLELINDDHWFWWYVRVCDTQEMGYVPFEAVELPNERLARENRARNLRAAEQHVGDFVGATSRTLAPRSIDLKHVHFERIERLDTVAETIAGTEEKPVLNCSMDDAPELDYSNEDSTPETSPLSSPKSSPNSSPIDTHTELIEQSRAKLVKLLRFI